MIIQNGGQGLKKFYGILSADFASGFRWNITLGQIIPVVISLQ